MTTGTAHTHRSDETQVVPPTFWRRMLRLELPTSHTTAEDVRPLLLVLGLPTFGLAFTITILTTYGPSVLLSVTHSPARVGALIGGEGAFALVIPLVSGALSDRLPGETPASKRMPFVLIGGPLIGAGLVILPFAANVSLAGISILMFFVGYYLYYPPYRAIYADILPKRLQPRAQSSQAILRGAGFGVALIAGGLLLGAWTPLPFIIGAAVIAMATIALKPVVRLQNADADEDDEPGPSARDLFLHHRPMQIFAAANSLWEFSLAGLKTFVILYLTHGLHRSSQLASACLAMVAVAFIVGAPIASRLAERVGIVVVMSVAAAVYGATLCLGVIPTSLGPMLLILPVCAFAGSILMTLPQALAFTLAPEGSEGAAAGLVDFSRGVGVVLGPAAVGGMVGLFSHSLSSTSGYAVMWPTIGVPVLLSLVLLRRFENQPFATNDP
jgi:MFS family permease